MEKREAKRAREAREKREAKRAMRVARRHLATRLCSSVANEILDMLGVTFRFPQMLLNVRLLCFRLIAILVMD